MVDISRSVFASVGNVDSASVVSESSNNLESNGNWSVLEDGMLELSLITLGDVN